MPPRKNSKRKAKNQPTKSTNRQNMLQDDQSDEALAEKTNITQQNTEKTVQHKPKSLPDGRLDLQNIHPDRAAANIHNAQTQLLSLPNELRNEIYKRTLPATLSLPRRPFDPSKVFWEDLPEIIDLDSLRAFQLPLVCRAMHDDTIKFMYSSTTFVIMCHYAQSPREWIDNRLLYQYQADALRSLEVVGSHDNERGGECGVWKDACEPFPNLTHLRVWCDKCFQNGICR